MEMVIDLVMEIDLGVEGDLVVELAVEVQRWGRFGFWFRW